MVNIKKKKEKRPLVGLSVIVMKENNQVLLGRRKGSHGAGTWAFPGGHLEDEGFCACVSRELKEEIGFTEENFRLIDYDPVTTTNDFFRKEDKHYVTLYMRVKYLSGVPIVKEKDKCEEWKWFCWNKLPSPLFTPLGNLLKQNYNPFKK